jgi:hypothetical protein
MNSAPPGLPTEADQRLQDHALHLSAAKLNVYDCERLAYTERPSPPAPSPPVSKRMSAWLKAMYHWVLTRS